MSGLATRAAVLCLALILAWIVHALFHVEMIRRGIDLAPQATPTVQWAQKEKE